MSGHEDTAAELHAEAEEYRDSITVTDMAGANIKKSDSGPSLDDRDFSNAGLAEAGETPEGDEPNEREKATLRRVGENLPASAYLVAVVELCERFTFYGCQGLFQNYVSNSATGSDGAVGLGLGHQAATGLNTFFQFFAYSLFLFLLDELTVNDRKGRDEHVAKGDTSMNTDLLPVTPILGAIISDQYLGKYKTIVVFACIYWAGLIILWATALPNSLAHGAGLPGFIVAIIVIGLGTGGIKSNISPLIADQYQRGKMAIKIEANGERVIIDPAVTYQPIYMIFYGSINVGSLSLLATPFMERDIGFWSAYLLCFCMFCVGLVVLALKRKSYVVRPPSGSIITDSFKAVGMMIRERNTDAPKPSWRAAYGKGDVKWDDRFVDLLKRALTACKIFTFYPIFWLCYLQFSTNFVSQAAQMMGHGMPNDLMQNFDPISILVLLPLLDRLIYPLLRKLHIPFRPITRISLGFLSAGIGIAYAAIVQKLIYSAGPCYEHPLASYCAEVVNGVTLGNNVHIAVQTPAYVFIGLGEILLNVTGLEYAYTKAPPSMKSFVQALYLVTTAFGAALTEALVPAATDPAILWMYVGVAVAAGVTSVVFYGLFRGLDKREDELNAMDGDREALPSQGEVDERRRSSAVQDA